MTTSHPAIALVLREDHVELSVVEGDPEQRRECLKDMMEIFTDLNFKVEQPDAGEILKLWRDEGTPKIWIDSIPQSTNHGDDKFFGAMLTAKHIDVRLFSKRPRSERIPHMQRAGLSAFDRKRK